MQTSVDVLVAGAGPAGSTIARLLAGSGRRVLIVDPERCRQTRLEMVAPSALATIAALNLTNVLSEEDISVECLGVRRDWGPFRGQLDEFIYKPGGLGYIVDRQRFDARLRYEASRQGAYFEQGSAIMARLDKGNVIVSIKTSRGVSEILAPLVVDATGRPAFLARRLGSRRMINDHLVARLCRHVQFKSSELLSRWLEVSQRPGQSWQYSLSGPRGLNQRWEVRRGKATHETKSPHRVAYDASSASLTSFAGPRWLAIGDAAIAFDPIASQGLQNAMSTALSAACLVLSGDFKAAEARRQYSDLLIATYLHSEIGRMHVYMNSAPDNSPSL